MVCQEEAGQGTSRPSTQASSVIRLQNDGEILLKTATVFISGPDGMKKAICFFNDDSQKSYIRKGLADALKLKVEEVE